MLRTVPLVLLAAVALPAGPAPAARCSVAVVFEKSDPRQAFAAAELARALRRTGHEMTDGNADVRIVFDIFTPGLGPQAFRIRREGPDAIRVVGGDSLGAMYGGLELAEMIDLGGGLDAVRNIARKPYIFRRGLKFNIPFDARSPSYDDTGTAAGANIPVMWDLAFWREFLDSLARCRYNVLTLWTNHPYPGIVRLPKYPGVNYDDVCVLRKPVDTSTNRHFPGPGLFDPANLRVVRKMTLDEKIAFWKKVFDYAEARGIEIYFFHWNIYVFGAEGKHGVTIDQNNPRTIEYVRYCIRRFLETYPQVDGIGVTAGEHFLRKGKPRLSVEKWLWETYGRGVMDAKAGNPDRTVRFIFRQHMANLGRIVEAFADYDGPFNTGHKYARARLYSTTTSPYLDFEYRSQLEQFKVPCWLNLRNDDLFVFRWGDPGYVREFLQNVPRDVMRFEAGFYMGPDGFVWGREFVSKDADLRGRLEIDKHWFRFLLWGRLAYDLTLRRERFEQLLARRWPGVDAAALYDTWAAASQIVPQVNRFFFRVNDFQFSPEGCIYNRGFLTVEAFFKYPPLAGSGIASVQKYAEAVAGGRPCEGITPMEVADNLDRLAARALAGAAALRKAGRVSKELDATLADIEAMAHLGRYYADKIRAAAELAVFRADPKRTDAHRRAVERLTDAVADWQAYARTATARYRPQLFSRTHYMDWDRILNDVKKEVETVRAMGRPRRAR